MVSDRTYAEYIMASKPYGTLYIGVTGDIISRGRQHRDGEVAGFSKRYGMHRLVWFEYFGDVHLAIQRENP